VGEGEEENSGWWNLLIRYGVGVGYLGEGVDRYWLRQTLPEVWLRVWCFRSWSMWEERERHCLYGVYGRNRGNGSL